MASLTSSSSGSSSRSSSESSSSSSLESPRVRATATEKFIDLKVTAEENLTKASARLSEKAVLLRMNLALGLRRIIHHEQSPRHDKCLDYVAGAQTAATERRLRREQEARERAEWERAVAREWSAYKSSRQLQHHRSRSSASSRHKHSHQQLQLVQGAA